MRLLGGLFPYTVKVGFSMALPRSQKFRENVEAADFIEGFEFAGRRRPLWEFSCVMTWPYGIFLRMTWPYGNFLEFYD